MDFDVPSCNNREVPQYFVRKHCVEFLMGEHVNYFDITEFQGHGLGSSQDFPIARRNPLRGSLAPMREPNQLAQPPQLPHTLDDIQGSIRCIAHSLLRNIVFVPHSLVDGPNDSGVEPSWHSHKRYLGDGLSTSMNIMPHHGPHCGHSFPDPMQEPLANSYMEQVSTFFNSSSIIQYIFIYVLHKNLVLALSSMILSLSVSSLYLHCTLGTLPYPLGSSSPSAWPSKCQKIAFYSFGAPCPLTRCTNGVVFPLATCASPGKPSF